METHTGEVLPANGAGALMKVENGAVVSAQASTYMPAMTMEVVLARREAVVQFTQRIMKSDVDFGVIPGTQKPTLLKPGAEKLNNFFGLEPSYEEVCEIADWTGANHGGEPLYYIRYRCRLTKDGRVWGSGEGSANTWETKHRYRWVKADDVPASLDLSKLKTRGGKRTVFEFDFALDKAETTGKYGKPQEYWDHFKLEIAAGRARRVKRAIKSGEERPGWEIYLDELQYRVPNDGFPDLINTVQKMAQKRALVAATLIATSASEFFTQDVEDLPEFDRSRNQVEPEPMPPAASTPAPTQAQASAPKRSAEMEAKREAARKAAEAAKQRKPTPPNPKPWQTFREMVQVFGSLLKTFEDEGLQNIYAETLQKFSVQKAQDFKSTNDAVKCYAALMEELRRVQEARGAAAEETPDGPPWPEEEVPF